MLRRIFLALVSTLLFFQFLFQVTPALAQTPRLTCIPGTTVILTGQAETIGTGLLVRFDGAFVGGGSVKPGGTYAIPLQIDRRTRPGEYPVTVEVRHTRTVLNEAICVVPAPDEIPPAPPSQPGNDLPPTEQTDVEQTEAEQVGEIVIVRAPGQVARGSMARLEVRATPLTGCSIRVFYPSYPDGMATADGLEDKMTDEQGDIAWNWRVGGNTAIGSHRVTVTCGDATAETTLVVITPSDVN